MRPHPSPNYGEPGSRSYIFQYLLAEKQADFPRIKLIIPKYRGDVQGVNGKRFSAATVLCLKLDRILSWSIL